MDHAWVSLASFMHKFVQRRKQELTDAGGIEQGERGDLFSRLVAASDGIEKYSLDEQEVVRINYLDRSMLLTFSRDWQHIHSHVCWAWYVRNVHSSRGAAYLPYIQRLLPKC
jgi:hypothetical protein